MDKIQKDVIVADDLCFIMRGILSGVKPTNETSLIGPDECIYAGVNIRVGFAPGWPDLSSHEYSVLLR